MKLQDLKRVTKGLKPMTDSKEPDYEVGYGRPPKASQFKKGQSGNPSGARRHRKRKLRSTLRELAIEEANELMQVTLGGRLTKITKKEAVVKKLFNDVLSGTPAQRAKVAMILMEMRAFDVPHNAYANDQAAVRKFIERLAAEAEKNEDPRKPANIISD